MAAFLVSEGYALADVLDYDKGLPFEELVVFQRHAQKFALGRHRQQVDGVVVALASLFDKKIIREFNSSVDKILATLGPVREETREEKMKRTMRELNKLKRLMGSGRMDQVPPWERKGSN